MVIAQKFLFPVAALLIVGCADGNLATSEAADERPNSGFAVVELFTSQGCSSCPSADKNLARIEQESRERNLSVFVLSFHVDYWNDLGWKDPYSRPEYSAYQRDYARQFGSTQIYTPQMVVNGKVGFVGSGKARSDQVIREQLKSPSKGEIQIAIRNGQQWRVGWKTTDLQPNDVIKVALVQRNVQTKVANGENHGRHLRHVNVVRSLKTIDDPQTNGEILVSFPSNLLPKDCRIIAYVQSKTSKQIRCASSAVFPAS